MLKPLCEMWCYFTETFIFVYFDIENNIAPNIYKDLLVSHTHYSYHKRQYSSKPHTNEKEEFAPIVLSTISRALD